MSKKHSVALTAAALVSFGVLAANLKPAPAGGNGLPVQPFSINKYLGQWYEIARLDYYFEKNLDHATANYSLNNDGSVKVINRGFNVRKQKWKSATGKAKFRGSTDVAALKVSFFGPFYADYTVIALDENYKYAMVAGKNTKYLWLLSREKTIPAAIRDAYLQQAKTMGFDTGKLIWVNQQ